MTRPRYLDRLGIDDRHIAGAVIVVALLVASLFSGCEIPQPWPVPPVPDPINPPGPVIVVPIAGEVFVYVVEETGERSAETALTLNGSSEWWHKLGVRNVVYRWYDDDQCPPSVAAAVKERPGLLLLDRSAKVLYRGPLPKSTAGIDSLLKGFGK